MVRLPIMCRGAGTPCQASPAGVCVCSCEIPRVATVGCIPDGGPLFFGKGGEWRAALPCWAGRETVENAFLGVGWRGAPKDGMAETEVGL